jgi:hypothetical protein
MSSVLDNSGYPNTLKCISSYALVCRCLCQAIFLALNGFHCDISMSDALLHIIIFIVAIAVAYLVETLSYQSEGGGFNSL